MLSAVDLRGMKRCIRQATSKSRLGCWGGGRGAGEGLDDGMGGRGGKWLVVKAIILCKQARKRHNKIDSLVQMASGEKMLSE